jgi:DNA-binding response OmpR family regulator
MKKRILVLDTGHLIGEKRCRKLLDKNYHMRWACSREDALRQEVLKEADLLLLDLDVPWAQGWALLPQIRETNPSLFVLGFTERSDLSKLVGASELDAVVEKPIDVLGLMSLIGDLLKRKPEERQRYRVLLPSAPQQRTKSGIPPFEWQVCPAAYCGWGIND